MHIGFSSGWVGGWGGGGGGEQGVLCFPPRPRPFTFLQALKCLALSTVMKRFSTGENILYFVPAPVHVMLIFLHLSQCNLDLHFFYFHNVTVLNACSTE